VSVDIQIRAFRRRDLARVVAIEAASFRADAYSKELFLELFADCARLFFVARCSGRIAGYIVTCAGGERAEVVSIAVDPRYRGIGAGKALMRHTLARLKRAGVKRVLLMVRAANTAGLAFYRWFGFRRVGRVARYYGRGGDGVRMRRDL
jgi:[ribosomal protein S18]-alanine N-acetyltransferase